MLCCAVCRYDFAEWLSSRVMMQLSNEAGQSQVCTVCETYVFIGVTRPKGVIHRVLPCRPMFLVSRQCRRD
jgi:hypothetical protein